MLNGVLQEDHRLLEAVDRSRLAVFDQLDPQTRSEQGQYGTPAPVAAFMASMHTFDRDSIRLLDAGAGVGSLTAAFVEAACRAPRPPAAIQVTAFEPDPLLCQALRQNTDRCTAYARTHGVDFSARILQADFVEHAVRALTDLFTPDLGSFHHAIQNPPYRKIATRSHHRRLLGRVGIEVSNLYAGFVALTLQLLEPGGQFVAITPRSFCNGPYFAAFRRDFLRRMRIERLHVFDSRREAFQGDGVLQENIITRATRATGGGGEVLVTSSGGDPRAGSLRHRVAYRRIVPPGTPVPFIHLVTDGAGEEIADAMSRFDHRLSQLGIGLSTGRVVDFRARRHLRDMPDPQYAPLIYPAHLQGGRTTWPRPGLNKPNAIARVPDTRDLLVPPGVYVLVKRFSSKEQRRRICAYLYDSDQVAPDSPVGFENHTNYFHHGGAGLNRDLAIGLALYLNSSLVDRYFRLFSGHTQVNATDLRNFPFPSRDQLVHLGRCGGTPALDQDRVDRLVHVHLLGLEPNQRGPMTTPTRIEEARKALQELGFDRPRCNERSALTLLALLHLEPDTPWDQAQAPLRGITEMMDFFREHYGKDYAPNTRETVRRQTVHQFLDAGLLVQNPDDPSRPVNSAQTVYQVIPEALDALRHYTLPSWPGARDAWLAKRGSLRDYYAKAG